MEAILKDGKITGFFPLLLIQGRDWQEGNKKYDENHVK
jgi:hypothetical protein